MSVECMRGRPQSYWLLLVCVVYTAYLATALTLPDESKFIAGALLLLGWAGLSYVKNHFYPLISTERLIAYSFALFSLVSILSYLFMPQSRAGQIHLEDYGVFIMIIPLYLLLRQFRINTRYLLVVLSVVLIGLGIQSYLSTSSRPSGGVNAMRFANVSLIMALFPLIALIVFRYPSKLFKSLLVVSAGFGLFACFLAQSRGALLSIPVLALVYGMYLHRNGHSKLLVAILLLGAVSIAVISQQPRMQRTVDSVERYFSGDSKTPLGARFDMYKVAISLIKEKPIFGHGLGSYGPKASKIRDSTPGMNREVGMWNNPHNEILLVMVEKGVLGLSTLLLVFWAPAYFFWGALRRSDKYGNNAVVKFYSLSGMGLLIVYSVAGQSVALFQHDVFNHFFVLMVILFASQIRSHEHYLGLDKGSVEVA